MTMVDDDYLAKVFAEIIQEDGLLVGLHEKRRELLALDHGDVLEKQAPEITYPRRPRTSILCAASYSSPVPMLVCGHPEGPGARPGAASAHRPDPAAVRRRQAAPRLLPGRVGTSTSTQ